MKISASHSGRGRGAPRLAGAAFVIAVLLFLAAALVVPPSAGAAAAEAVTVKAYGKAVNTGDTAKTKKEAIDQALKEAVKEALSGLLAGSRADPLTIDTAILANAGNYVFNYKILSERWLREMLVEEPPPGATPETGPDTPPAPGDETAGGEVPQEEKEAGTLIETYHVLIEASVDLGSLKRTLERLTPGAAEAEIKLVILDITDYDTFSLLMASLRRMPIIEDISYRSFKRGRFVMRIKSSIDTATLADEIAREAGKDFVVSSGGPGMIIIRAFPEDRGSGK